MSRLLSLAGSPPLQALEARWHSAYEGCVSLDTSTASSTYNLAHSNPPTCAGTCGDGYKYVAIQAQFCFCFPSPPAIFTTYNDSDCSINCDFPYQHDSCGGVTLGTLIDVYSFYAGSGFGFPGAPGDDGDDGSGTGSLSTSNPASSPSEQTDTSIGPTTIDEPSPVTPGPGASSTQQSTGVPGMASSPGTPPGSGLTSTTNQPSRSSSSSPGSTYISSPGPTTVAEPQPISTYTITLWMTVTSYTTVYPGGPLQSTVLSMPTGTTYITGQVFTSSCDPVTVTSTYEEGGSVVTSILPGSIQVMTYDPYVSEVRELEVEGVGSQAITRTVLAAVVPVENAATGVGRRDLRAVPSEGTPAASATAKATSGNVQLATAAPGWVVTASGSQAVNASATRSQFPVTARAARFGAGWQDSMMVAVVFALVFGAF